MKLKFIIPSVLVIIAAGILAFNAYSQEPNFSDSASKKEVIASVMSTMLEKFHYAPQKINDAFSKKVFKKYIKSLDGEKKFLLQSDVDYLKKYKTSIDDELKGLKPLLFYKDADSILNLRMTSAKELYPKVLSKSFNFTKNDSLQRNRSKVDFAKTKAERKKVWKKMLKFRTLTKLLDLKKSRDKAVDTAAIKSKTDKELEAQARKDVKKSFDLYFDRIDSHYNDDVRFADFLNAVAGLMDPHTNYFSPKNHRYFDEQMSGTFYGIGALLTQDDYYVKIENIVTGGPAWKQGELKAGDLILKVKEGENGTPIDMTGYTVQDAVKIIRGKKDSVINLTVKHIDGTIETVPIQRGEVKVDAVFAHSYIIDNKGQKIGFLVLPEFYFNKSQRTGPGSSAYDVKAELKKLKEQNVDGVIMDLRFNGGGSLGDAIDMAGLFVGKGPIVQVREGNGTKHVLKNRQEDVEYSGPLAIMVNEYSASASEILSAAMQDYKRGVIIGSKKTFGKGTVQRMIDLTRGIPSRLRDKFGKLGALKLTIEKFYRINGGSTQLKGVSSDIVLPDPYYGTAESKSKSALPWDSISPADYHIWKDPVDLSYLKRKSHARLSHSNIFSEITSSIDVLKKINKEKKVPLNLEEYETLQENNSKALKAVGKLDSLGRTLDISNLATDSVRLNSDSMILVRNQQMLKGYKKDPYLHEAVNVIEDMIARHTAIKNNKLTEADK